MLTYLYYLQAWTFRLPLCEYGSTEHRHIILQRDLFVLRLDTKDNV